MNIGEWLWLRVIDAVSKIRISRRSRRKVAKAANQGVDAAANVLIDVLRSLRRNKS